MDMFLWCRDYALSLIGTRWLWRGFWRWGSLWTTRTAKGHDVYPNSVCGMRRMCGVPSIWLSHTWNSKSPGPCPYIGYKPKRRTRMQELCRSRRRRSFRRVSHRFGGRSGPSIGSVRKVRAQPQSRRLHRQYDRMWKKSLDFSWEYHFVDLLTSWDLE